MFMDPNGLAFYLNFILFRSFNDNIEPSIMLLLDYAYYTSNYGSINTCV